MPHHHHHNHHHHHHHHPRLLPPAHQGTVRWAVLLDAHRVAVVLRVRGAHGRGPRLLPLGHSVGLCDGAMCGGPRRCLGHALPLAGQPPTPRGAKCGAQPVRGARRLR
eukprot:7242848-Pyramimonas_sp.AAC.1